MILPLIGSLFVLELMYSHGSPVGTSSGDLQWENPSGRPPVGDHQWETSSGRPPVGDLQLENPNDRSRIIRISLKNDSSRWILTKFYVH